MGLSSSPSPTHLLFLPLQPLSKAGGCCPGLGRTKLLMATTSSNPACLYSAITLTQQAVGNTGTLWQAGGMTASLGSEGGTDLTGWGRRFEDHRKYWSAQQTLLRGTTVVVDCTESSPPACKSTQSLPSHSQPTAGEMLLREVDLKGKGTERKCGSSIVWHKGKPSVCTQQRKLCHGYNC